MTPNPVIPISSPRPVYDHVYEPLALFTIPNHIKQRLFQNSLAQYAGLETSGKVLIQSMSERNEAVSLDFDIKKHHILDVPFRLILPANTNIEAVENDLEFIAISYACHSTEWRPAENETFNEYPFGQNMVRWLLDFRSTPATGVWIDSICIDQNDEKERSLTIASMDCIYRDAKKVAYLLEDSKLKPNEVVILQKVDNLIQSGTLFYEPHPAFSGDDDVKDMSTAVTEVLCCRFFNRAWCFHEFTLPRISTRPWDESSATYKIIGYELRKASEINDLEDSSEEYYARPVTFSVQAVLWAIFYLHWRRVPKFSLTNPAWNEQLEERFVNLTHDLTNHRTAWQPLVKVLSYILVQNVSVQNDLVPIALNSLTIPVCFKGHIQDKADFHWLSHLLCILSGDAAALASAGWTLHMYLDGRWRHTWIQTATAYFSRQTPPMSLEGIGMITPECIELDLIVFKGRFRTPEQWSLDIATTFVHDYLEASNRKQTSPLGENSNFSASRSEEGRAEFHRNAAMLIAIAIERGLSFTADRWRILLNSLPANDTMHTTLGPLMLAQPDEQLWSLAHERLFNGASTDEMSRYKDTVLPYLTTMLEHHSLTRIAVLGTLQFITGNTIGTLATKRPLSALPQIFKPADANTGEIVFAMPTVLDRDEYHDLNRVFVLRPISEEMWSEDFTLSASTAPPPEGLRSDSTCNKANRVWRESKRKADWQLIDKVQLWAPAIMAAVADSLPDQESAIIARKQLIVGSK